MILMIILEVFTALHIICIHLYVHYGLIEKIDHLKPIHK
jgi:hypothetical protein